MIYPFTLPSSKLLLFVSRCRRTQSDLADIQWSSWSCFSDWFSKWEVSGKWKSFWTTQEPKVTSSVTEEKSDGFIGKMDVDPSAPCPKAPPQPNCLIALLVDKGKKRKSLLLTFAWSYHKQLSCLLVRFRRRSSLRAFLYGGGGPLSGEVTCSESSHLSCTRDQIKLRHYMDRRVTPPNRVTSPTWGPPPPCKQALILSLMT